jgi:hypothetical protein
VKKWEAAFGEDRYAKTAGQEQIAPYDIGKRDCLVWRLADRVSMAEQRHPKANAEETQRVVLRWIDGGTGDFARSAYPIGPLAAFRETIRVLAS